MVDDQLTLLRDVTNLLKTLIQTNISELNGATSVVLDSPGDMPAAMQNQLSLFLYHISENPFLRNQDFVKAGPDKLQSPPLTLDLFYLLTPYSKDKDVEQIILAKVMRLFYDNAILTGTSLGDSLLESGNNELRVIMNTLSLEQLNQIWGIFPGKSFHVSLSYIVTPLKIASTREFDTQRVITKQWDTYQRDKKRK